MKGFLCLSLALVLRATWGEPENAVTRVVGLLEALQTRIKKDGAGEQQSYDKYACWCETTTGQTAAAITAVKELLKTTGNTILRLKGSVATLSSEIAGLIQDIKSNQEQQDEATSIREKESTAYMAERAELEQAIAAMEKGIAVLSAATNPSFVQTSTWASAMSEIVAKVAIPSLSSKVDEKQLAALAQLSSKNSYAPQSATIEGILSDMYTTFTKNLQSSTAEEAKSHRNYEDLMATYQKQMNTLQETLVKKQQRKSEDEIQLADATQVYADSEDQLKAEIKFFDATKASCSAKTDDWSKRSSLRTVELEGISKALTILTSDEAKDLFAKSIKPGFSKGSAASFVQLNSKAITASSAAKAVNALEVRARETQSFRLASLAVTVRMQSSGHFDEVLKSIDGLLAQLREEEQADIAKVDECKGSYQDITQNKNDLDWKIQNNKAKVQKHEKAIGQKTAAKKVTIKDIATADKTLEDMAKTRKEENDAYKTAKSDDEKAIGLLQKAKVALKAYYRDLALLQQAPEPEMKLSDKKSAENQTKGIFNMLDMIIEDLDGELAEAKAAETAAQVDYEKMKEVVEDQKAKLNKAKINLEGQIAEEGTAKTAEEDLQNSNGKDLQSEKDTEADLKKTCDDAIANQGERRKKRKIEADGLTQAREFLDGMSADAFVQSPKRVSAKSMFPTFKHLSFLQRRTAL